MSEFSIQYENKFWGTVVFGEGDHSSDFLKDHQIPIKRNFYQEFYSETDNPLKRTRDIQFQSIWKRLANYSIQGAALDIGCGRGEFVHFLRSRGCDSYGIEPALKSETEHLKKLGMEDIASSTVIPQKYGLVSLMDVLEHFTDTNQATENVANLVAASGLLLVKVPNKNAAFYRLAKSLRGSFPRLSSRIFFGLYQVAYPPPHYQYFSAESLRQSLEKRFEVLSVSFISECPIRGLWSRFWMVPKPVRPVVVFGAAIYRLLSLGSRNDGIVMIARKR